MPRSQPIKGARGRSIPVTPGSNGNNATKQRRKLKQMTELELTCGITPEEFEISMAAQRERVKRRYGLTP